MTLGCEFESYTRHNKNVIGEGGDGRPPHKVHFPRKSSEASL